MNNQIAPQKSIWTKNIMNEGTASIVFSCLSLFLFGNFFSLIGMGSGILAIRKGQGKQKTLGYIGLFVGAASFLLNVYFGMR